MLPPLKNQLGECPRYALKKSICRISTDLSTFFVDNVMSPSGILEPGCDRRNGASGGLGSWSRWPPNSELKGT
jgi:hypothetical protein